MSALAKLKDLSRNEFAGGGALTKPTEPSFVSFGGTPTPSSHVARALQKPWNYGDSWKSSWRTGLRRSNGLWKSLALIPTLR